MLYPSLTLQFSEQIKEINIQFHLVPELKYVFVFFITVSTLEAQQIGGQTIVF